jgi:hypothetical protein
MYDPPLTDKENNQFLSSNENVVKTESLKRRTYPKLLVFLDGKILFLKEQENLGMLFCPDFYSQTSYPTVYLLSLFTYCYLYASQYSA